MVSRFNKNILYGTNVSLHFILLMVFLKHVLSNVDTCDVHSIEKGCGGKRESVLQRGISTKYLLYDVNPGEGFNLRRDVYMRVASLVRQVNEDILGTTWILVLPPWGPLYHWKSDDIGSQTQLPWSLFFDIPSLNEYVPAIEFHTFFKENGPTIGELYYLQHYSDFWANNHWDERFEEQECTDEPLYHTAENGNIHGWYWGYDEVYSMKFKCLSIQGTSRTLKPLLLVSNERSLMIDRAEVILHDSFGSADYWMVRKSMKFAKHLVEIGNQFRLKYLNSSDSKDGINVSGNLNQKAEFARGGPYVAVHLRRQDFIKARPNDVPSISYAAVQIKKVLMRLKLETAFIATDASISEFNDLKKLLPEIIKYKPRKDIKKKIKDGGIAIIEQWICAHAKYFIGTHESTFSFRIQEEREILGFHADTTFNRLCGDNQTSCRQPSRWTITYA